MATKKTTKETKKTEQKVETKEEPIISLRARKLEQRKKFK